MIVLPEYTCHSKFIIEHVLESYNKENAKSCNICVYHIAPKEIDVIVINYLLTNNLCYDDSTYGYIDIAGIPVLLSGERNNEVFAECTPGKRIRFRKKHSSYNKFEIDDGLLESYRYDKTLIYKQDWINNKLIIVDTIPALTPDPYDDGEVVDDASEVARP